MRLLLRCDWSFKRDSDLCPIIIPNMASYEKILPQRYVKIKALVRMENKYGAAHFFKNSLESSAGGRGGEDPR